MRRELAIIAILGMVTSITTPQAASAKSADCDCKLERKGPVVRPLTEPTPVRKKERTRRILM